MNRTRGFTLFELMMVVAIIGIIGAIAVPNIREMNASNRQLTAANDLLASFNFARNAAISMSREVYVEAGTGNWRDGWEIKADSYKAIAPDGTVQPYPEKSLGKHDALSSQLTLTAAGTKYTYDRQGRLSITGTQTIDICDDRTAEKGHSVTLEPIGRVVIKSVNCS